MAYSNIKPLVQPDVYTAMFDFVKAFALPALPDANIYRAWQNRVALPTQEDFCVMSIISGIRVGTNVKIKNIDPATDILRIRTCTLMKATVQLDFYSQNHEGQQRAFAIEMVSRDAMAVDFLAAYNIAPLYIDPPKEMVMPAGNNQYNQRYMVQLHINFWASMDANVNWFNSVNLNMVNVDERYSVY